MEILHDYFLWSPQEIPLLFLLTPVISICYFFNTPEKSMSSASRPLIFSGITHSWSWIDISEAKNFALVTAATWHYLVTGTFFARKVWNVMKNKINNGKGKKNCHDERVVFNFTLFCYLVCFETLKVGFRLYLTNKIIKSEKYSWNNHAIIFWLAS